VALIGRQSYHAAAVTLLRNVGFTIEPVSTCKIIANRGPKKLYIDIAGKNLPYFGADGQEAFLWETHVQPSRLDNVTTKAMSYGAEPWLGFCYAILNSQFESEFEATVEIARTKFGLKLISIDDFRKHGRARSEYSWGKMELPRERVTQITKDPKDVV
jgi:hypothetical protein